MKNKLTPIEIEVIKQVCKEYNNFEIGRNLKLSPRTIQSHRYRIMKRLGIKTSIGLVLMAIKNKIIKVKIK